MNQWSVVAWSGIGFAAAVLAGCSLVSIFRNLGDRDGRR